MYRVYRNDDTKKFVETASRKFAESMAKQERKRGYDVTIKEKRNDKWYTIKSQEEK